MEPVITAVADMQARVSEIEDTITDLTTQVAERALQVFVSRVTAETARIFVNGEGANLQAGGTLTAAVDDQACTVTLAGVDRSKADVTATCE